MSADDSILVPVLDDQNLISAIFICHVRGGEYIYVSLHLYEFLCLLTGIQEVFLFWRPDGLFTAGFDAPRVVLNANSKNTVCITTWGQINPIRWQMMNLSDPLSPTDSACPSTGGKRDKRAPAVALLNLWAALRLNCNQRYRTHRGWGEMKSECRRTWV